MINIPEKSHIVIPSPSNGGLPIGLSEARRRHISYLENGPHLYVSAGGKEPEEEKILHSLCITQQDLNLLYRNAKQGIRLHLCREDNGMVNIVVVPIGVDNNLVIDVDPELRVRPIVNTLEPCPSLCPPLFSETSMNCWIVDNEHVWLDPNDEQGEKVWFRKGPDGEKIFVERPDNIPPSQEG